MKDITVEELHQKIENKEDFVFIDVREQFEYDEYNIGARLIPMGNIPGALNELEQHKNDEIVVHCRSGARSGNVKQFLKEVGYTNVRNLLGGILEWQKKYG